MKKRHIGIALTALIILILVALIALLRGDGESDPIAPVAPADMSPPLSPKVDAVPTQTAQQSDSEPESSDEEVETATPVVAKTYHFLTWQDALNEYARLAGEECERLKAEGRPQPEFYAVVNFGEKLQNDPELAALKKAMEKFMPFPPIKGMSEAEWEKYDRWNATAIPWKIWSNAAWIMVWAGKLPEGSQHNKIGLPNGKVYHLERDHQLRVTYQMRRPARSKTAEGARILESLRQRESDLYSALVNASDAEFDGIAEELKKVESEITALESPTISPLRTYKAGMNDDHAWHPDFKVIELDLGIVDKAPAEDD